MILTIKRGDNSVNLRSGADIKHDFTNSILTEVERSLNASCVSIKLTLIRGSTSANGCASVNEEVVAETIVVNEVKVNNRSGLRNTIKCNLRRTTPVYNSGLRSNCPRR